MILVIDNYDSFTFNLVQALGAMGQELEVRRNDEVDVAEVERLKPAAIVLSPGPGKPEDAGVCLDLIRGPAQRIPLLGVCLGHQAIASVYGGRVVRAPEVVHGKTTRVRHDGSGVFAGLPDPLEAARYHSLVVDEDLPETLAVNARSEDGLIMGLRDPQREIHGVQFHPESIATPEGAELLAGFLRRAGLSETGREGAT